MSDSPSSTHQDTTAQYTPGPWMYYLDAEGYYGISHKSEAHEPGDIAHVYVPGVVDPEYDDHNEGLANARLIAAAPMLLDALRMHVDAIGHTAGCCANGICACSSTCKTTRAAIAAAEGGAS